MLSLSCMMRGRSPGLAFDACGHPECGVRPEPDELLRVLDDSREAAKAAEFDTGRRPNLNGAVQVALMHGGWVAGGWTPRSCTRCSVRGRWCA